jgi:hypothetical protein
MRILLLGPLNKASLYCKAQPAEQTFVITVVNLQSLPLISGCLCTQFTQRVAGTFCVLCFIIVGVWCGLARTLALAHSCRTRQLNANTTGGTRECALESKPEWFFHSTTSTRTLKSPSIQRNISNTNAEKKTRHSCLFGMDQCFSSRDFLSFFASDVIYDVGQ